MAPDTRPTGDPDRCLTFADERSRPFHELLARLRAVYPARGSGVVLPFRRIFMVAQRPFDVDAGGLR
ncbi:MAG: hypothetical protein QM714_16340 [Nocardioides sp.]|uniref:hypothetical protein n=1 Tax=Nocardioides sp. TaxID=35761 RepID=UPI0039E554B6